MNYLERNKIINKYCKTIDTNHLIALCEIGTDYESFCNDLEILIKSKKNKDLVQKVYDAIKGKFSFGNFKYKNFMEKHKHTIEIMNKYYCLDRLTIFSYNSEGKRKQNLAEDYFYQYIKEHKKDIEKIKALALKVRELGFHKINFGEQLDFTEYEYELYNIYSNVYNISTCDFAFLENMEIQPTYLKEPIKYKTKNSCYCMFLQCFNNAEIIPYEDIILNSLIFDLRKLPNKITIKSTINVIQELANKNEQEYINIKNAIDLSITTSNLVNHFNELLIIYNKIDKEKNNKELLILLNQMTNILGQLQSFEGFFQKQIISNSKNITNDTIEKEKRLYLD